MRMTTEIRALLAKRGIRPSKKVGQNFLVDEKVVAREIEEAEIKPHENVLEIGPGPGTITFDIAKRAKAVYVIEKDKRLAAVLKEEMEKRGTKNVELIIGDALKAKWPPFDKLVANIPYQISSGVIERLGKSGKPAVLVLQKEFAERLVAEPGEPAYSRITILARYFFTPVIVELVSRAAFWPQPEVDSAIVKFYPRKTRPEVFDEAFFFKVVKALFSHPNKTAGNALYAARRDFEIGKEKADELKGGMPLREKRVFNLEMQDLVDIANWLFEKMTKK